jgi:hypothetical protein
VEAGGNVQRPWPFEIILISMLLEQEKVLGELRSRIEGYRQRERKESIWTVIEAGVGATWSVLNHLDTFQILSERTNLRKTFLISCVCKMENGFDSRRLHQFVNKKPFDFGAFYFHTRRDACRERHIYLKGFKNIQKVDAVMEYSLMLYALIGREEGSHILESAGQGLPSW